MNGLWFKKSIHLNSFSTKSTSKIDYSKTISLFQSSFKIQSKLEDEQGFYLNENQAEYTAQKNTANLSMFTLLDGPPFANGRLHVGHFLNKMLKDIYLRIKILEGFSVSMIPGWDVHGLPVEIKAIQELPSTINSLDPQSKGLIIRNKASEVAEKYIQIQKRQFIDWGIFGNWNDSYSTKDPAFESRQLRILKLLWEKGLVKRALRPVYWSPSSKTALAESELEYNPCHKSRSIFFSYPLINSLYPNCNLLLWTSTPWTVPANMAIAINATLEYVIIESDNASFIIAESTLPLIKEKLFPNASVINQIPGKQLIGSFYVDSIFTSSKKSIYHASFVEATLGTGIVHIAPAHGQEDFEFWNENIGSDILNIVDDDSKYSSQTHPKLKGIDVLSQGTQAVIDLLRGENTFVHEMDYVHSYPIDWRTKKPILIRVTYQWFIKTEPIKEKINNLLLANPSIDTFDLSVFNRILQVIQGRSFWCISRQRSWGNPIPVFYNKISGEPLISSEIIEFIAEKFAIHPRGSNCWWEENVSSLLPPSLQTLAPTLEKGYDTFDCWLDSGTAWSLLQGSTTSTKLNFTTLSPADVVIEGIDQLRGWFQSMLLTSVAAVDKFPFKRCIVHGFVLDEQGHKMSKSVGNVVDPTKTIEKYGLDTLRLWVASSDYRSDVRIGPSILSSVLELKNKIRNTIKFLISNLSDLLSLSESNSVSLTFKDSLIIPSYSMLPSRERYLLHLLFTFSISIKDAYTLFEPFSAIPTISTFCNCQLSSFYFDMVKDILYCYPANSLERRSVQFVLLQILLQLKSILYPLLPYTSYQIKEFLIKKNFELFMSSSNSSIYQNINEGWNNPQISNTWEVLRQVKQTFNKLMDTTRRSKIVTKPEQCHLTIILTTFNSELASIFNNLVTPAELTSLFQVASYHLHLSPHYSTEPRIHLQSITHPHDDTACSSIKPTGNQIVSSFVNSITKEDGTSFTDATNQQCTFSITDSILDQEYILILQPSFKHKCPRCWLHLSDHSDTPCNNCMTALNSMGHKLESFVVNQK